MSSLPYRHAFLALSVLLVAPADAARAQDVGPAAISKIDRGLRQSLHAGGMRRVIVSVKPGYREEIRRALREHGDTIAFESALVEALAAEVHSEDILELAEHPMVEAVSADAAVYAGGFRPGDAKVAVSTLRATLGLADPVGTAPTGRGVGVAIIDSGIAPVADLEGHISAFFEVTPGGVVVATHPKDPFGHGTHIAGLIGGSGQSANGIARGVAPDVHLVGVKVLDRSGAGTTSDVIRAIEFLVEHKDELDVQVVNLSLGHPVLAPAARDPLVRAVEHATQAGLIVVASAGNAGFNVEAEASGYAGVTSPGNAPSVITVGAAVTHNTITRSDDVVASFSSRGPTWFDAGAKPDIVAPGHQLTSSAHVSSALFAALGEGRGQPGGDALLQLSGTSMAAGVTSGVVALLLETHAASGSGGTLSANTVKAILQFTAIPVGEADWLTQGAGQLNADGSIRLAQAIDPAAPVSTWWLRADVGAETSSIGGVDYGWSTNVIWGDDVFNGDTVYYNLVQWADSVIWGSQADDNIIWGTLADDNIIWGTAQTWGSNLSDGSRVLGLKFDDNIIWGTRADDNIIWGTLTDGNIIWGTALDDNIIWGTLVDDDHFVWGATRIDDIVLGTVVDDNIIWGTALDDNIIWGTALDDNIIWGTALDDNIIWGTALDDNIIWGTVLPVGEVF